MSALAVADRFAARDPRALARALTWAETDAPEARRAVATLRHAGAGRRARVVGVTGAPGAGKSTLVDRLVGAWRARGARVAVLAVDPSSPFTGGALLGDRVRMTRWAEDPDVFVRSMASRGRTGGLAPAALDALALLEAFGFDVVVVETVGVGQAEVDVVSVADSVLVALAPGQGDDVQAAKAGLMEVADAYVLTKADRPEAARLAREVRDAVALRPVAPDGWSPPVLRTALGPAAEAPADLAADGGLAAVVAALDAHAAHAAARPEDGRRAARSRFEALVRAEALLRRAARADVAAVVHAAGPSGATVGTGRTDVADDADDADDADTVDAAARALLRRAAAEGW